MITYQEPEDIYEAMAAIDFEEALDSDDPRYQDTLDARGDFKMIELYRHLFVNTSDPEYFKLPTRLAKPNVYTLFCGHIGCGKSTELRRVAKQLNADHLFFVIFLDVLKELDINNLTYADVLLALAKQLFETLKTQEIHIDTVLLANVEDWFKERIESNEKIKGIAAEIRSGAEIKTGVPFLSSLFTSMTGFMHSNSTYKQEIRNVIISTFSQFATAFNRCVLAAEDAIQKAGKGRKILFVIDGTDRLRNEDGINFFVKDVHQLTQIQGYFVYCAPIHLFYEQNQIHRSFTKTILPMIKLHGRDKNPIDDNQEIMRKMLFKRFPAKFFTDPTSAEKLIEYSGGCPRELFRLVYYSYLNMQSDKLDQQAVDLAVKDLAIDYKRLLDTSDYSLLVQIDHTHQAELNSERVRHFLYQTIVLEYNNFWREPHPAIRLLPAYQEALNEFAPSSV
jgi:hypothetical protein